MTNTIPPMTHPLGQYWSQPSPDEILVDDVQALMLRDTYERLQEYDTSMPTGTYIGKMWKRIVSGKAWLCWYGPSDQDHCRVEYREIFIL